jgi:glutathione-regulated potassium-efflux system ancillary protein KefF
MAPVLVLAAHPDLRLSRVNRALLDAARSLAAEPGAAVEVRDLYALYPDYVIDVPAEQAACERARLIVWQHPIQWYAMPPLMKLWLDEVLTLGWAYGRGANGPGAALRGKDVWLVASTGGAESAYRPEGYNRYFFDAFLPPYEQTAALCGLRFLPPLLQHGAHAVGAEGLRRHVAAYRERLASYPDWPEMAELEPCPACDMPPGDRPADPMAAEKAAA